MFDQPLDAEHVFEQDGSMGRTRVRHRRRVALAISSIALALLLSAPVAAALGRQHAERAGVRPAARSEQIYVVRPGDTVWTIAERVAAGEDPRPWVDAIAVRNGIQAGSLVPGQSLILPRAA